MKKIRLLIADTDRNYYQFLNENLIKNENIEIIGHYSDGKETVYNVLSKKPDVLIMDNILDTWDGMGVLESLQYYDTKKDYIIIFITSMYSENIKNMLISKGANYVFNKNCYINEVIDLIIKLYNEKQEKNDKLSPISDNEIFDFIQRLLLSLGFKASNKGYKYLKDVILEKCMNNNLKTKEVIKIVSKKIHETESTITRSIMHSIETSFNKCKEKYLYNLSYNKEKQPNVEEFLDMIQEEYIMYFNVYNK